MDADDGPEAFETGPTAHPTAGRGAAAERTPAELDAEDDDLREGLTGLSRLSNSLQLEDLLTRVATYAVGAIPGADGAGLTLVERDRADTIVATAEFVREVDAIQYGIGEGPCITAAREGQTVMSGSLGGDPRWRRFGGGVARLGVHSVLSLPLSTADGVVGAMNVYAHDKNAFDERSAELGELFAAPAAVSVQNAQVLAHARRLAARLRTALESRVVVERAVGVVMSSSGVTAEQALTRLRTLSQHEHHTLVTIANQIVEEAASRARARRSRS